MTRIGKSLLNIRKTAALRLMLCLFLVTVLIRLPNLRRPVSKHHEFITAVILMNIESWRQAGGGSFFHYTPLMNYQNPGDKHPDTGPHIDPRGNHLYLSLGSGWYILPYFFYQLFHWPASPLYLRILNLLFGLGTVVLLFYFLERLIPADTPNKYFRVLAGCAFFMFSPLILWFSGNGYAHTALMTPFLLLFCSTLLPALDTPQKIPTRSLFLLAGLVILLVFIDWFIFFLCLCTTACLLLRHGKDRSRRVLALVLMASAFTGTALLFWQFASYAGAPMVARYWQLRFLARSAVQTHGALLRLLGDLSAHFLTGYLPLLILLAIGLAARRSPKARAALSRQETLLLAIYGCSLGLYELVLLNWSSSHDFSIVPAGVILAWLAARFLPLKPENTTTPALILLFFLLSIGQYYYINRPGAISRDGMAFDTFEKFGKSLQDLPPDYKIFGNLPEYCPMIEYYAGRNITSMADPEDAKEWMRKWKITKGIWIENEGFQFLKTDTLKIP